MGLLEDPVNDMLQRVSHLLAEWPDNPLLLQLRAICQRLLGAPFARQPSVSESCLTLPEFVSLTVVQAFSWHSTCLGKLSLSNAASSLSPGTAASLHNQRACCTVYGSGQAETWQTCRSHQACLKAGMCCASLLEDLCPADRAGLVTLSKFSAC